MCTKIDYQNIVYKYCQKIKMIRIHPENNAKYFRIEYIYDQPVINLDLDRSRIVAVDFGINNTASSNDGWVLAGVEYGFVPFL